jgi:hypothetical protein
MIDKFIILKYIKVSNFYYSIFPTGGVNLEISPPEADLPLA